MRGGLRAGSFVRSGPSGAPPSGLRAWETANAAPGSLVRPSGAIFHDRVSGKAYLRTGAPGSYNWTDLAQVGNVCNLWYGSVLKAASRALSIADGSDPSVVGLVGTVGSICQNVSQTLAWLKYGAGNYSWRSLNEVRASATVSGGAASYLDVTESAPGVALSIPATSGFCFRAWGVGVAPGSYAKLRINGAPAALQSGGLYLVGSSSTLALPVVGLVASGGAWRLRCEVTAQDASGFRCVNARFFNAVSGSYCGFANLVISAGVVSSVGVYADAAYLSDGTTASVGQTDEVSA